jgi:hypothetical protein
MLVCRRLLFMALMLVLSAVWGSSVAHADAVSATCLAGHWTGDSSLAPAAPAPTETGGPGDLITTEWSALKGGGALFVDIGPSGDVKFSTEQGFADEETVTSALTIGELPVENTATYPVAFTRQAKDFTGSLADDARGDHGPLKFDVSGDMNLSEDGSSVGEQAAALPSTVSLSGAYDCRSGTMTLDSAQFGSVTFNGPPSDRSTKDKNKEESRCHAAGLLPDPLCTPGAVTQESAARVCAEGYLSGEGQRRVSQAAKLRVYAEYGIEPSPGAYQIDHLIPLGVGGANTDSNLWPEAAPGYHAKDTLEHAARRELCRSGLDPATQQEALLEYQALFGGDWITLNALRGGTAVASSLRQTADRLGYTSPLDRELVQRLTAGVDVRKKHPRHRVSTVSLTGFGATEAAWDAHHQADLNLPDSGAYDPMPGQFAGAIDDDEFNVTFTNGRVDSYFQEFQNAETQADAARGVQRFLPPDAKLVVKPRDLRGKCAAAEYHSSALAAQDHNPITRRGDIIVTYDSYYEGAQSVPYSSHAIRDAYVDGVFRLIPRHELSVLACG